MPWNDCILYKLSFILKKKKTPEGIIVPREFPHTFVIINVKDLKGKIGSRKVCEITTYKFSQSLSSSLDHKGWIQKYLYRWLENTGYSLVDGGASLDLDTFLAFVVMAPLQGFPLSFSLPWRPDALALAWGLQGTDPGASCGVTAALSFGESRTCWSISS